MPLPTTAPPIWRPAWTIILAKPFEKADLAALLARWKRPAVAKTPSGRGAA